MSAEPVTVEPSPVLVEQRGQVVVLRLNRPAKLNAWTDEMDDAYHRALANADADPAVRAMVVTGIGRGFCAGADMSNLVRVADQPDSESVHRRPRHFPLTVRKPLIGAINGPAAGLGMVEALYCDVRIGSASSRFLTSFVSRGLIAEYGISWLLPEIVGRSRALDLLLSGRQVEGEEAYRIGLLDRLVPSGHELSHAVAYAEGLARNSSPLSMNVIKRQVLDDSARDFQTSALDADARMRASFHGPDLREGTESFAHRREPRFAPLPPTRSGVDDGVNGHSSAAPPTAEPRHASP